MTTANLTNFVRFVKQARTPPMAVLSTAAAAIQAETLMLASPWRQVSDTVSNWPVRNPLQDGFSDSFDAAKYVGNYANGAQRAYATMAAYRYELPSGAYAVPVAEIASVTLNLHADRWLVDGVRIAAYLSDALLPSEDPAHLRTGIAYEDGRLPQTDPATDQTENLTLTLPANTPAQRYLYIIVALENYRTTRDFWLEGGALIVGTSATANVSRDLGANANTTLPILASNRLRLGDSTITGPLELATATGLLIENETIQSNWQTWEGMLRMFAAGAKEVTDMSADQETEIPWQNLKFTLNYGGSNATGSVIRINVFDNNLMHETPTAVGIINTPTAFPAEEVAMTIVDGEVTAGEKWFWAFVDNNGDGKYVPGAMIPAGMGRAVVGSDATAPIQVNLFDVAPNGYARVGWDANAQREYAVTIAALNTVPEYVYILNRDGTSGRPKVIGREYLHEGDFLAHTLNSYAPAANHLNGVDIIANPYAQEGSGHGADNPQYYRLVGGFPASAFTLTGTPYEALTTPSIELPTGTVTVRRPLVRWNSGSINKFSSFDLQIRNSSDQVVVLDLAGQRYPVRVSGKYPYIIEQDLDDGTYEIRVRTHSPDRTPRYSSAWSTWASFTVAYSEPEVEAAVVAAGLKLTAPGTGEALGWGNCVLRGHAHLTTPVSQLKFATSIPATGMVKVRLVAYLEALPPYRAGGTPTNDTYFGTQTLLPAEWYNGAIWRGTATELNFVAESHPTGTASVTPILVVDLDPMGYDANHPFRITPVELTGPFNLYFFASPVGLYNAAQSAVGTVDQLHGLANWTPTLLMME